MRGVREAHLIDAHLIASADARRIDQLAERLSEVYAGSATLKRKEDSTPVTGPCVLLDTIFAIGRRGLTMQRYKGLGEMNADQLWETTLDPNDRTLLQVKIIDATDADGLFSRDAHGRRSGAAPRLHPGKRPQRRKSRHLGANQVRSRSITFFSLLSTLVGACCVAAEKC